MKMKAFYNSNLFYKGIFVFSFIILFFISSVAYNHVKDLSKSTDMVLNTFKLNLELEKLNAHIIEVESEYRAYIITENKDFLKNFIAAKKRVELSFEKVKKLNINNNAQKNKIAALKKLIFKRLIVLEKSILEIEVKKQTYKESDVTYRSSKNFIKTTQLKVNELILSEEDLLKKRQKVYTINNKISPFFLYSVLTITLLLICWTYYKSNKDFNNIKKSNSKLLILNEVGKQAEILGNFGSWTWNINQNQLLFSDNFYRILGEQPQSFVANNVTFLEFVHPEDVEILKTILDKILHEETLPSVFFRILTKKGEIKHMKSFGTLSVDPSGEKTIIGYTQDGTKEYNDLKEITERNKLLERLNQELSAFNYIASHDLQEPLRKIQTFISRFRDLKNDSISVNGLLYLEKIENSATRMRELIDDLLQFSKMNKPTKTYEKLNLNKVITIIKDDLMHKLEGNNISFITDKMPTIVGIPYQINQLFLNIIVNSINYRKINEQLTISLTCKIVSAKDDGKILQTNSNKFYKITIADNGIGFEPEYNEKIFVLFNRLHNKTDFPGTGIGLSICRKIIDNHDGFIFAEGKPNIGAVFYIYFPIITI